MLYEARRHMDGDSITVDFYNFAEAKEWVEGGKSGRVIHFLEVNNMYGRLPEIEHKSIKLETWENGVWCDVPIFT